MGTELDYGSAGYWVEMVQTLLDNSGPSQETPLPQPNARPPRNTNVLGCGTGGRYDRGGH